MWCTFDLVVFIVMLKSFIALVSKYLYVWLTLATERIGWRFGTREGGGVTSRAYMVYLWPYSVPVWKNLLDLSQGAATLIWLTQIAIWEFSSKVLAVEYDIFDRLVFKIFVGSFNARVFKFVWPKMCVMLQLPILWSSRASRSLGRVCGEVRNLIWWHMDKVKKGVIVKSAGLQFWLRGMYTKHYWLWHNATPAVDVSYMSS